MEILVSAAVLGGMITYGMTDQARKSGGGILIWLGIIDMVGTGYGVLVVK